MYEKEMKIKCPFNCGKELASEASLYLHLVNRRNRHDSELLLSQILFKIHEKIESLQNIVCMEGEIPLNQANDGLLQELKSLLENENV